MIILFLDVSESLVVIIYYKKFIYLFIIYYLFICSNQNLGALENFRKLTILIIVIVFFLLLVSLF